MTSLRDGERMYLILNHLAKVFNCNALHQMHTLLQTIEIQSIKCNFKQEFCDIPSVSEKCPLFLIYLYLRLRFEFLVLILAKDRFIYVSLQQKNYVDNLISFHLVDAKVGRCRNVIVHILIFLGC